MVYKDEYDGMRLGTRPGDVEGEESYEFSADASMEYDEEMEGEEVSELDQLEENRLYHANVESSFYSIDGIGHVEKIRSHFDKVKQRDVVSYSNFLDVYQEKKSRLDYEPRQYQRFDGIIDEVLQRSRRHDGINNTNNQYYKGYEPLRQNIAILRMTLYSTYFPDGEYNPEDPRDKAKVAKITQISNHIAHELRWQSRWQMVFNFATLNFSERNVSVKRFGKYGEEHLGAQKMYEMLYKEQDSMSWNPIKWIKGTATKRDWGLPHPESSPFCKQDMHEAIYNKVRDGELGIENAGQELAHSALSIEGVAAKLKAGMSAGAIANMDSNQREESVELAREILRKLRKVNLGRSKRAHDGVSHERLDLERANLVRGLSEDYLCMYQDLLSRDPSIQSDSTFDRARIAMGKLGHLTMLNARTSANLEEKRELDVAYSKLPDEYKKVGNDNEEDLIRDIEVAIEEIAKRQQVSKNVAPQIKSNVKNIAGDLHNRMTGLVIAGATPNIVQMAKEVNNMNEKNSSAVEIASTDISLESQFRR